MINYDKKMVEAQERNDFYFETLLNINCNNDIINKIKLLMTYPAYYEKEEFYPKKEKFYGGYDSYWYTREYYDGKRMIGRESIILKDGEELTCYKSEIGNIKALISYNKNNTKITINERLKNWVDYVKNVEIRYWTDHTIIIDCDENTDQIAFQIFEYNHDDFLDENGNTSLDEFYENNINKRDQFAVAKNTSKKYIK